MEKHQTAGRLVIRRPRPVVSGGVRCKFSECSAWISSHSLYKVSERDNVGIFSLSRSA